MITKRRGYQFHKLKTRIRREFVPFFTRYSLVVYVALFGIVLLIGVVWLLHNRLKDETYRIYQVNISQESVNMYNDFALFERIARIYSGSYYSTLRLGSDATDKISELVDQLPHVSAINLQHFADHILTVQVVFDDPPIKLRYHDGYYGVYPENIIPLYSGNTLGQQSPLILLPLYLSGTSESISGVMYQTSVDKLLGDYTLLQSSPIQGSITYVPGAEKYIIWNPLQRVYFNAKKSISEQLHTLVILKENYPGFEELKQIDVGSLVHPIVK